MIGHYPIEWMASSSDQGRPDVGGHRITEFGPVKRLTMLIAVGALRQELRHCCPDVGLDTGRDEVFLKGYFFTANPERCLLVGLRFRNRQRQKIEEKRRPAGVAALISSRNCLPAAAARPPPSGSMGKYITHACSRRSLHATVSLVAKTVQI